MAALCPRRHLRRPPQGTGRVRRLGAVAGGARAPPRRGGARGEPATASVVVSVRGEALGKFRGSAEGRLARRCMETLNSASSRPRPGRASGGGVRARRDGVRADGGGRGGRGGRGIERRGFDGDFDFEPEPEPPLRIRRAAANLEANPAARPATLPRRALLLLLPRLLILPSLPPRAPGLSGSRRSSRRRARFSPCAEDASPLVHREEVAAALGRLAAARGASFRAAASRWLDRVGGPSRSSSARGREREHPSHRRHHSVSSDDAPRSSEGGGGGSAFGSGAFGSGAFGSFGARMPVGSVPEDDAPPGGAGGGGSEADAAASSSGGTLSADPAAPPPDDGSSSSPRRRSGRTGTSSASSPSSRRTPRRGSSTRRGARSSPRV